MLRSNQSGRWLRVAGYSLSLARAADKVEEIRYHVSCIMYARELGRAKPSFRLASTSPTEPDSADSAD